MSKDVEGRIEMARTFRRNVLMRMLELDMTRKELVSKSGLGKSSVEKYLAARVQPTAYAVARIAKALDCSADRLLGLEDRCRH